MSKERSSNFELMRIISMFFILLFHVIHHGNLINLCSNTFVKNILIILELISLVHVNSFILITGYYQCKSEFKLMKVLKLFFLGIFYLVILLLFLLLFNIIDFNIWEILLFFIKNFNSYWFLKYYILVYLISPLINKLISILSNKFFCIFLLMFLIMFIVIPMTFNISLLANSDWYIFTYFVFIYLIGAYLRDNLDDKENVIKCHRNFLAILFLCCVLMNYLCYILLGDSLYGNNLLNYNNFFVIIQSVSYFLIFYTFKFSSKRINYISKMTLGVYLIHDNNYVREQLYNFLKINTKITSYKFILYILAMSLLVYISCSIIELIRQYIFKFIC